MQGIYTHIPETNYVPREYGVAAILLFLFMVHISLVYYYYYYWPYPVAVRSKAWACRLSLVGIGGLNPARGMDICILRLLGVVR